MAKKSKNGVGEATVVQLESVPATPVAPAAPALIKEFTVPPEQQELLRKIDASGAAVQRELGALEIDYISKKGRMLQAFEANRKEYETALKAAGKAVGVDFEKLTAEERWDFDFAKMTFKHVDVPKPS